MDEIDAAKLQVYSVEGRVTAQPAAAVCLVRAVGGVARAGQKFDFLPAGSGDASRVTLDWILRYERQVDLLDPPHGAKVQLSGVGIDALAKGVIITAVANGES
ncbi:hypothetical protein ABZX39_07390 [Streptomyces collinus]|uniref:hypothetical protein n=1 Tax=Streptomyces collinus TaxID=42684 RepID=UPI0033BF1269